MMSTTVTPATDARLGFTSLDEETAVDRLPVTGEVPGWLTGALVRVTPALLEVGGRRLAHWFDGLAMLNRFGFADGTVSYRNRFLDSHAYRDARAGQWTRGGFATDPCRSIFKRVQSMFSPQFTDNPNVNLARIGERYIAMTETPLPIEFDPETLETIRHLEYADPLKGHVTTAHPHHDPARDELVNYVARFSRVSEYVVYGLPAGGSARRVIARLPVKEPAYMHSFGMSGRYLILAEYPLRVKPLELALSRRPFIENYRWRPEEGTRFRVVDRLTGRLRGTYETGAFFCFHHVNAFDRGSELVVDLVAYDDPGVIDALYLGDDGPRGELPATELRRYTIDLERGSVRFEPLAEGSV
ncbi:MAG TPA: carotenoid oxygenase family protein, partial [Thermoleophilaceae bacterium]|nr:carotenoid oxygenase family protein [Thermoleophilaceae bacterium]